MQSKKDIIVAEAAAGKVKLEWFTYVADYPIAVFIAAANVPINVPILNDSDFLLEKLSLVSYTGAGVFLPNPDYTITFFDSASGRQYQSAAIHVHNVTGDGFWPFILPEPMLFVGGSTLVVTLNNNTGVPAEVNLALHGSKIFYYTGYNRSLFGIQ
ncbi:MAG: hypothetical protein GY950_00765 [bacterium]|nr:hypothetical protein [bacterium]